MLVGIFNLAEGALERQWLLRVSEAVGGRGSSVDDKHVVAWGN